MAHSKDRRPRGESANLARGIRAFDRESATHGLSSVMRSSRVPFFVLRNARDK